MYMLFFKQKDYDKWFKIKTIYIYFQLQKIIIIKDLYLKILKIHIFLDKTITAKHL